MSAEPQRRVRVDATRWAGSGPVSRTRRLTGAILAPLLGAGLLWAQAAGALTGLMDPRAQSLLAIFAVVVVAWVTEVVPIAVTALLIAPAMVAAGVCDARSAFYPYADPILFLFVGGFFIAAAMQRHGLDRRIARQFTDLKLVRGAPARIRFALMVTALLMSMWISNTASVAILLPIFLGTLGTDTNRAESEQHRVIAGGTLSIAYACSVGGLGTLVGSPPNAIAARFLEKEGITFGFVDWFKIGLPAALVLLIIVYLVMQRSMPASEASPPQTQASGPDHASAAPLGEWSRGEKVTALAFVLAVVGWMVPGVLKAADTSVGAQLVAALPLGSVALIASSVLFFFRDENDDCVLPWNEAAKIDWGVILLFGGGLTLGAQMLDTKLAHFLGHGFVELTGVNSLWALTALVLVFTVFFTEVCSNTATSNMMVPLVIAIALELKVPLLPPVLAVGLGASCAFMLPVATAPNAIAYGTGAVRMPEMMRVGMVLNVLAIVVLFALLRILCPLYGWT